MSLIERVNTQPGYGRRRPSTEVERKPTGTGKLTTDVSGECLADDVESHNVDSANFHAEGGKQGPTKEDRLQEDIVVGSRTSKVHIK